MATTTTEFAILGMLTLKPMSGYEIRQLISESIGHFWGESYGQLYPSLKRLEQAGLATKHSEPEQKRDRFIYTITEDGREQLRNWLGAAPKAQPPRSELLLKLFFLGSEQAYVQEQHVRRARQQAIDDLKKFGFIGEQLRAEHAHHPQLQQWLITLNFGRHRAEAIVNWADETLEQIAAMKAAERTTQ
jgi:DNA-binding PadR family transcriptional regulator